MTTDEMTKEIERLRAEVNAKTTRIMRLAIERNAYRRVLDKADPKKARELDLQFKKESAS
jgi:hypothetical protein